MKIKKKALKIGKVVGSIVCIIVGMSMAGFGISNLIPKKQYSRKEVKKK